MNLTPAQLQAIDNGEAVTIVIDGRSCVLLNSSAYSKLREAIEHWDPSTMQQSMAELMSDDWNDPAMSIYDE